MRFNRLTAYADLHLGGGKTDPRDDFSSLSKGIDWSKTTTFRNRVQEQEPNELAAYLGDTFELQQGLRRGLSAFNAYSFIRLQLLRRPTVFLVGNHDADLWSYVPLAFILEAHSAGFLEFAQPGQIYTVPSDKFTFRGRHVLLTHGDSWDPANDQPRQIPGRWLARVAGWIETIAADNPGHTKDVIRLGQEIKQRIRGWPSTKPWMRKVVSRRIIKWWDEHVAGTGRIMLFGHTHDRQRLVRADSSGAMLINIGDSTGNKIQCVRLEPLLERILLIEVDPATGMETIQETIGDQ